MQCLLILKSFLLQRNLFLTCSFIKANIKVNTKLISSGISNRRISHWILSTTLGANKWWQVVTSASLHCYLVNCSVWQLGSDDTFACDMIVHLHPPRLCDDSVFPSPFSTVKSLFVRALWHPGLLLGTCRHSHETLIWALVPYGWARG